MPKVIFSGLVEDISGKQGGSMLKRVKSGSMLGSARRPRVPRTAKQQQVRGLVNTYAGKWYSLEDSTKELWRRFASLSGGSGSGFNVYVQLNVRLLKANHGSLTEVTTPPLTPSTPPHIEGWNAVPSDSQVTVSWTAPVGVDCYVQVYFAVEVGYSMKGKEKWSLVETVRADVGEVVHSHDYPGGIPLVYRGRTIDVQGRISPYTERTYGATPGARYGEDYYGGGYYGA